MTRKRPANGKYPHEINPKSLSAYLILILELAPRERAGDKLDEDVE